MLNLGKVARSFSFKIREGRRQESYNLSPYKYNRKQREKLYHCAAIIITSLGYIISSLVEKKKGQLFYVRNIVANIDSNKQIQFYNCKKRGEYVILLEK